MALIASALGSWTFMSTAGIAAIAFGLLLCLGRLYHHSRIKDFTRSKSKDGQTHTSQWQPSSFRPPRPPPFPDWSIETTRPLAYRAFRYGPKYNITMGLRAIDHQDWIQLDNQFPKYHADKAQRIEERGHECSRSAPEAFPAAVELLEELSRYLPDRYPSLYRRTSDGLENLWSGESFNIVQRPLKEDPITMCARLVQDDLALMLPGEDGQYYLLSGAILLAGFWRLKDKFGMPLSEIHKSGDVPQFREKLETGMNKFFARLRPEELYSRFNYFIQVDDELAWSSSIGPEDGPDGARGWDAAEKDKAIEHHWFRSERQTLRRLPRTGAVVFTIRTYFVPVKEMATEEYVPGRLASAIRSWGGDVGRYKGREKYERVLLAYLDQAHQEQVDGGLVLETEDEVHKYPW
ncbi:alpha-1,2-mannosyltransferase [Sarocladium implicatum]|nr:alpha-1,2-mannosyltransferase [Sarocladium implicatum]